MNRHHPQYSTALDLVIELIASTLLSVVLFILLIGVLL